jgi:ABC-type branched-subunit amino acid transport system ATPase component
MASQLGERYVIIDYGKSVHSGLMSDLVQNQDLIHQYLGASIQAPISKSEA